MSARAHSGPVEGAGLAAGDGAVEGLVSFEVENGRQPAVRLLVSGVPVATLYGPAGRLRELLTKTAARIDVHPSITCPRCGRTSWHPVDIASGYCGGCHDWTSLPEQLAVPGQRDGERSRR